jgi:glyoxylase-like metal-dependent hydrolase (beta-lactamase superfamily II)
MGASLETIIDHHLWQVGGGGLTHEADAAVYLVRFGDKAALVDAGTGVAHSALKRRIAEVITPNVTLEYLLLTHCHYDHTGGAAAVRKDYGCRIVAHELDAIYLERGDDQVTAASWYGMHLEPFPVDWKLQGDETEIALGDGKIMAIHCPGHSPGSMVFTTSLSNKLVLFGQDVHGPIHPALLSDETQYRRSLENLLSLNADLLLEGHYGIIQPRDQVKKFIRSFL